MFHEDWWLDIVSGGRAERLSVSENGQLVGILPVFITSSKGIKQSRLPPFTHVLGPAIDVGDGNDNAKMHRRFRITTELIEQVPRVAAFKQVLECTIPEALAFQCAGFRTTAQYTIRVNCYDLDAVWTDMRQKTRRFIRRSQEKYKTSILYDCDRFSRFYIKNLHERNRFYRGEFAYFPELYAACKQRDCGEIFAIENAAKELLAAIFVVWGHGVMYYLLTTRDRKVSDYGVVSALVLRAMQEANARSLILDLDGIASQPLFHFLSGFGGKVATRTIVERRSDTFHLFKTMMNFVQGKRESTFY